MAAELVIDSLLNTAGATLGLTGKIALDQLPKGMDVPAVAYIVVNERDEDNVSYQSGPRRKFVRYQINVMSRSKLQALQLYEDLRLLIDKQHQITRGGKLIISNNYALGGPCSLIPNSDVWRKPADFVMLYYE